MGRVHASIICCLLFTLFCLCRGSNTPLTKLKDPLARCLDGSQAGYYFQKATSKEHRDSWVIHFMGGGECASKDECDARLEQNLGSSRYWPDSVNFTAAHDDKPDEWWHSYEQSITQDWGLYGWWLLDDSNKTNPDMHGWNHVFMPYCSQDLWSGQQHNPVTPDGKGPAAADEGYVYAGHLIFRAILDALDAEGLPDADTIVLSGNSAGGMGMWLHLDWVAGRYEQAEVVGLSIAGYYTWNQAYDGPHAVDPKTELPDFSEDSFEGYVELWDAFMDADCEDRQPHRWWCMVAHYALPYVSSRVYIVQAQTDRIVLQMHCRIPTNPFLWDDGIRAYIHGWHHNMSAALLHAVQAPGQHGVFSAACFRHDAFMVKSPLINGINFKQAFVQWLTAPKTGSYIYFDDCGEFCNPSCALPDIKVKRHAEVTVKWEEWDKVVW